ncbi:DUF362 domain-containing protein [Synechococcus sp. PCC 7336]|uniref:DUF362 domain-containing protein n=1 Tax=Synechococcus sp. PCC 7336 TaxID=195250 RepID=UPI0003495941|nr:DUF362 domain-containing protein [Synechococcus sp. PCC 7336]
MPVPSQPLVSLQQVARYDLDLLRHALVELLAPWGGMTGLLQSATNVQSPCVLLKPNLLTGARPQNECTTRPELVRVVAEAVREAGGKPFIGDSPAFGSAYGVASQNGLVPICEALDVPIVEFRGQRFNTPEGSTFEHLRLSREALGADVVINLPKVKSHMQLTVTLGVKNLFGCVPGKMKAWWHMEAGKDQLRFGKMLVETALAIAPQLTIADGIIGHEGNGPSGGTPRPLGVLAASANVFALDRLLMEILAVDPQTVPIYIAGRALGSMPEMGEIEIVGANWQELRCEDWQLPDRIVPIDFGAPRVLRSTLKHLLTLWSEARTLPSRRA